MEFSFLIGELEPLFFGYYLYDIKKRERVSETFHFSMNTPYTLSLIGHSLVSKFLDGMFNRFARRLRSLLLQPKKPYLA
jgi:hypothetical protein